LAFFVLIGRQNDTPSDVATTASTMGSDTTPSGDNDSAVS